MSNNSSPGSIIATLTSNIDDELRIIDMNLCAEFDSLITIGSRRITDAASGVLEGLGDSDSEADLVQDVIRPQSRRISSLTCLLHTREQVVAFLSLPSPAFECLEVLKLAIVGELDGQPHLLNTSPMTTIFQSAHNLYCVTLHLENGLHPSVLNLPYYQLTAVCISGHRFSPTSFLSTLRSLVVLVDGDFEVEFDKNPSDTLSQLRVSHLQRLQLCLHNPKRDPRLFELLILRSLRDLIIFSTDYEDGHDWDVQQFTSFISCSSGTLETVKFHAIPPYGQPGLELEYLQSQDHIAPIIMDDLLSKFPMVHTLALPTGVYLHQSTMNDIAQGRLLPSLESLEVSHYRGSSVIWMVLNRNSNSMDFPRRPSAVNAGGLVGMSAICELTLSILDDAEEYIKIEMAKFTLISRGAVHEVHLTIHHPYAHEM